MVHQVLGLKYAKKIKQKFENYFLLKRFSKSDRNDLDQDQDPFFPVRIQDPDPDPHQN